MEPYAQVKFRVLLDGKALAGVSKITALHRETKVIEYREGSDPSATHESPGLTKYSPITLTRGKTEDRDFEDWANQVYQPGGGLGQHVYKVLTLEVLNDMGQAFLRTEPPVVGLPATQRCLT